MKSFRQPSLSAVLMFALMSFNALAAGPSPDVKALQAADQAWAKAFNAGDAAGLAQLYDKKAILLPPGAPAVTGRAAIKEYLGKEAAEASKAGIAMSLGANPAGAVSGTMGWQSGSYTVKDKAGKVLETGKYLSVSTKKAGKWLYVCDTWNADAAPAPVPAGSASAPKQ
jgi:ketosteroid isomerase-like protein